MLYIFHVDTGTMLSVEMNLALEDASMLKEAIKKITGIPSDKQVLLASGGESLEPNVRVCSYSAGTDTNPIYLFSKEAIEGSQPPNASVDHVPNADLKEEVDSSLNLPPTIQTVSIRCQLAQQIWEKAKVLCRVCEKLVHDQHLQQQGWAAVIANLEDVTADFSNRSESFEANYTQYLETRQEFLDMLESFSNDVAILSKIPILPGLLEQAALTEEEGETVPEETEDENKSIESEKQAKTLLEWISEKDSQYSVHEVADHCRKGLEQFNESVLENLKSEVKAALDIANKCEYREIKGLEDRLYGLDQLKTETGKLLQEQTDLAQAFHQNQLRASNLGDASILPDLCASHKRQLVVMLQNHSQLRDIKRRCLRAKQELVTNLHHRLKWVMFIECRINEMEMKLMMYHECLKRLRRQLSVLQQLHLAASTYMTAVAEVVRRRAFSQAFLLWANDLACQLCAVHSEEVARRKNFHAQFDGHFLSSLFPGLEDMPPPFATQAPQVFDDSLPKLSVEDIEALKNQLPELALSLSVPDTSAVTQFFLSRSATLLKPEPTLPAASFEDRIVEAVTAAGLSSNLDPALLQPTDSSQSVATTTQPISSDRGFESETDTEEFEKVGQSPSDAAGKVQTQEESTPKKDLFSTIEKINSVVGETVSELKTDVGHLKQWILCERTELECLISQLNEAWATQNEKLKREIQEKNEALEKLTVSQKKLEMDMMLCTEERDKAKEEAQRLIESSRTSLICEKKQESQQSPKHPRQAVRSCSESQLGTVEALFNESIRRAMDKKVESIRLQTGDLELSKSQLFGDGGSSDSKIDAVIIKVLESEKCSLFKPEGPKVTGPSKSVHNVSPSSSIVTIESTSSSLRDAATSPEPSPRKCRVSKEKLSESTNSLIQQGKISIATCNEGDIVLVIWDDNFGTYTILQESSSYTYFLHLDSLCALGLRDNLRGHKNKILYTHPRKQYVVGEVVNKEYCQAKKPENRYNVPVGSRFYRVRVKPLTVKPHTPSTSSQGVQSS